jgi:hypothetical protein
MRTVRNKGARVGLCMPGMSAGLGSLEGCSFLTSKLAFYPLVTNKLRSGLLSWNTESFAENLTNTIQNFRLAH